MARLPIVGVDTDSIGHTVLNEFLEVSHNADGTLKADAVTGTDVSEAELSFSDNTTNDATQFQHGLLPKLSGDATDYLDGTGNWATWPIIPGTVGDGVTDDRAVLQTYIDAHAGQLIFIPEGIYLIGKTATGGLIIPSDTTILMHPNAILQAAVMAWADLGVIELLGNNIKIIGGQIDGDKAHNATGRMYGIHSQSASNVIIDGMQIYNIPASISAGTNGGDGIKLGAASGDTTIGTTHTTIRNCTITGCVRQGITVTLGTAIKILDNTITGTTGTDPGAGIDLEPNDAAHIISDVRIQGNLFEGNNYAINMSGPSATGAYYCKIIGNTFGAHRRSLITLKGPGHSVTGSNTFIRASSYTTSSSRAINFNGADSATITGNTFVGIHGDTNEEAFIRVFNSNDGTITGNTFQDSNGMAILIDADTASSNINGLTISGNTFKNCSSSSSTAGMLRIRSESGSARLSKFISIMGNIFRDDRGGTAAAYAIRDDESDATSRLTFHISGNIIEGMSTAPTNGIFQEGSVVLTASLPAAGSYQAGGHLVEDGGAGDVNLIIYSATTRHRIDGGANV